MASRNQLEHQDLLQLMTLMTGDEKHSDSATSTLEVIWTLYDRIMRVDPQNPLDPERDRFLLSKGHGPMAYYAVLAAKEFISVDWLSGFGGYDSPLGWHPDRNLIPGVEIASGSLGHGLPVAVGMAAALRARSSSARVVCLVGDGELDEGSNHEAIAMGGRLGLEGLITVVIDNRSASYGWPGGIVGRFEREDWSSAVVDGRDPNAIAAGFDTGHPNRPHVVVAEV